MGVSCQILIKKPNGGHRPGYPVSGVVKYSIDEPLNVKTVVLSLIGKGHCSWTETRSSNNTTQTVTYTGKEKYFAEYVNVIEKTSDEVITTIPLGSYEFPFEFILPKDIPPSYRDKTGYISYTLKLKFKRPGLLKFDRKFKAEVPVYNCVDGQASGPVIFGLEKVLIKPMSRKKHVVNVKVETDKSCLSPGDTAHLTLVVTNDTNVNITAIKSELMRYKIYRANCGHKKVKVTLMKGSTMQSTHVPKNAVVNLTQNISTVPNIYSVNSRVVQVEYRLKVTVRLPVPYINASVEMPIVIGDKFVQDIPEDDPPSYWEVVCVEEKGKE